MDASNNASQNVYRHKHGDITRLTDDNYFTWQKEAQFVLDAAGTWEIVNGDSQPPNPPAANASHQVREAYEAKLEKFKMKRSQAASIIYQSCSKPIRVYIKNMLTPSEMWQTLVEKVDRMSDPEGPAILRQEFNAMKFDGETSVQAYITKLIDYVDQLADTEMAVRGEEVINQIVTNLPPTWHPARTIIMQKPKAERSITFVTKALQRYEHDIQAAQKAQKPSSSALLTTANPEATAGGSDNSKIKEKGQQRGNTRGRGRGRGRRGGYRGGRGSYNGRIEKTQKGMECWYCLKPGHTQSECRTKKQAERNADERGAKQHATADLTMAVALIAGSKPQAFASREWYIDSGATDHFCGTESEFESFRMLNYVRPIHMGNGTLINATGIGTIQLRTCSKHPLKLTDVLFVPDIRHNLIAVSKLDGDYRITFTKGTCYIYNSQGQLVAEAQNTDGLYRIHAAAATVTPTTATTPATAANLTTRATKAKEAASMPIERMQISRWHERLGHLNVDDVVRLVNMADGMKVTPENGDTDAVCRPCLQGKQQRIYNRTPSKRATERLELIHSDSYGPFTTPSLSHHRYFIIYIDDYSRMTWIFFLQSKGAHEITKVFLDFKAAVENSSGLRIRRFRCDNGRGEYDNKAFKSILTTNGITFEPSTPYTQNQNGVSERKIRTITERARSMFHSAGLPQKFWAEACNTATYLVNRSPTKALDAMTPYEAWNGSKPRMDHIRRFGCDAYRHVPAARRTKIQEKTRCCIMLGYVHDTTKLWKLWDPIQRGVINAADIKFDEDNNTAARALAAMAAAATIVATATPAMASTPLPVEWTFEEPSDTEEFRNEAEPMDIDSIGSLAASDGEEIGDTIVVQSLTPRPKRRAMLAAQTPAKTLDPLYEPASYREAITGPERVQWQRAMDEEYSSLQKNKTWRLVEPPATHSTIACKWVFKKKLTANAPIRYKARLVIKGFEQRYGVDYDETFAPVAMLKTIRILLALAAYYDWEIHHMDVKTAFLNPAIDREVYMAQPEGFEQDQRVCQLLKALYGLKQAPRAWHADINRHLRSIGFMNSTADENLYLSQDVLLVLFVDDTLIIARSMTALNRVKSLLAAKYEMSDLGEARQFLGLEICRNRKERTLSIHQTQYIDKVLARFELSNCNGAKTPMEASNSLRAAEAYPDAQLVDQRGYQSRVGSIMYAMIGTRPDLAFSASMLSRFNSAPIQAHHAAAKHCLRYLQHTRTFGIQYGPAQALELQAYTDSDWAGDKDGRKSTSGYVFTLLGGAITWRSNRQSVVALSSTEAEYIGLTDAAKEAVWLRSILTEIDIRQPLNRNNGHNSKWRLKPTTIRVDSQGAMGLTANSKHHERTKHIDIKYHYIRESIQARHVDLEHVPTEEQTADILTKPLARTLFEKHRRGMGVVDVGGTLPAPP